MDKSRRLAALQEKTPTARGTFATTPFVHVLVYMLDEGLTGTLVVDDPTGCTALAFAQGTPWQARKEGSDDAFGEHLARIVNLPMSTTYAFYEETAVTPSPPRGHRLQPLLESVRAWQDRSRIRATLAPLAVQRLELGGDVDLSGLVLTEDEEGCLAILRAESPPLQALLVGTGAEAAEGLVYVLALTRQFDLSATKRAALSVAPSENRERRSVLPAVVEPQGDPTETTRAPVRSMSRRVQPVSEGTIEVEFEVPEVPEVPEEERNEERELQAMTDFRLAEAALGRSDFATAQRLAAHALAMDGTQADYAALDAWVRTLGAGPAFLAEGITRLTELHDRVPTNERALLYRGKLFKRSGRLEEALSDFSMLLAMSPKHVEAASEVRVLRKRVK
jgi:tetratricopeptide (TPR) repeat protein